MKLFKLENNYNYTAKCPNCPSLLKLDIETNKLIINGECKNGHTFNNITSIQLIDFIKNTYYSKYFCYKCQTKINEHLNNYICFDCDKLYCSKCFDNFHKEKNHKISIFNNNFTFCKLHNIQNTFYCDNCKINICENCKNAHDSHCIKSFLDIIPKNMKKKKANIDEYKNKINNLLIFLIKKKEEIDKRFNILKDFLNSLLYINEKLLKKFNNSIFDYYNFHNFYQFFNYQNNESCFDQSKNLNYIFFGPNPENNEKNKITIIKEEDYINKGVENFNICDYKNLRHLKDNIFFLYEQKDGKTSIKFFEYKDFSFKLYFLKNLGNCDKIDNIKIGYYNNLFIMTKGKKSKIYVVKYNLKDKEALMTKLYDPYHKTSFNDIIDIKDENYIVSEAKGLKIFYDFYKAENIIKHIKENYTLLYNINSSIFLCEDSHSNYHFYNSEKYERIKIFNCPSGFKYAGNIKNTLLIFTQKFLCFHFMDLKYMEIVQKLDYIKTNRFLTINNNGLYEFFIDKDSLDIKQFNLEKGSFLNITKIAIGQNNINQKNIKYIDDNYILLVVEDELEIFKL